MPRTGPMILSRTAAVFVAIDVPDIAQAADAEPIVDSDTTKPGTDDEGWIDCRAYASIHATIKAVGAEAIITAEVKTTEASDPISLLLGAGSATAGNTTLILDTTIRFGFIRFLAVGEVGEGNTVDLHVLLK